MAQRMPVCTGKAMGDCGTLLLWCPPLAVAFIVSLPRSVGRCSKQGPCPVMQFLRRAQHHSKHGGKHPAE